MSLPRPSPKQAHVIWLALTGLAIATLVALVVALVWGLGQVLGILSPVIWPLAIAGVISYLLDPLVGWFERRGLSRVKAVLTVFGVALLIFGGLMAVIVPQLVREMQQLSKKIPDYSTELEQRAEHWLENTRPFIKRILKGAQSEPESPAASSTNAVATNSVSTNAPANPQQSTKPGSAAADQNAADSIAHWLSRVTPEIGQWLGVQAKRIGSWLEFIAGLALVPFYAFYLLREKRKIRSHWMDYLPMADSKFKDELVFVLGSINDYLIAFFRGQVVVAFFNAVLYTIGFFAIGLPYALLLGASALLLTIIPFIGAMILFAVTLIISIMQFGDWTHPLLVVLVFSIVLTLENAVVSPRVMHGRVGLHPLTIIVAVMIGTTLLGGLLGGILAIPLTAVLRVVMTRYVWKRRAPED
jgi:predicted PurR-regulated permease PerM